MHSNKPIDHSAFNDRIHQSHLLDGNSDTLRKFYHSWARTYDTDVGDELYCGPEIISSIVSTIHDAFNTVDRSGLRVLDAGCGTGLVGAVLSARGYQKIDGFDLSPDMTALAESTGAYASVQSNVDLNQPLQLYPAAAYDLTVCCGVFTLGHVRAGCLRELVRVTKPGGFVVVSTRKSYFETSDFNDVVEDCLSKGLIEQTACFRDAYYIAEEGAHYWVFKVCDHGATNGGAK